MALVAPSTNPPSSQRLTTRAKRQDEACSTIVWETAWPAPSYDTCSLYQTLVPCKGAVPVVLCPRESQVAFPQPSQHRNQARDSTPDGGTLTGIFVAIAGLIILGMTVCIILKRKRNEGGRRRHSGGTRTARGRNSERQSHHDRSGRPRGGSRRRSSAREARTGVLVDQSVQNNRTPGIQSRNQERYGTQPGAGKDQRCEGPPSGNKEPGTTETQSALKNHTQINRDRFRPAVSDQIPAAGSSTIPIHAAHDSTEDAESTAHGRAVEDDQEREATRTPEAANEEEADQEQANRTTHRQDEGRIAGRRMADGESM